MVLGLLSVIAYLGLCWKKKQSVNIGLAFELMISALGTSGGVKVCWFAFSPSLAAALQTSGMSREDVAYFFLGGFALIWISIQTIWRILERVDAGTHISG
jgi:hypothetical protein